MFAALQERLLEMERKKREVELADQKQLEANRRIIEEAASNPDEPVDIAKVVDGMFDFLPPDSGSEAPPPSRFKVSQRTSH